MCPPGYYHNGFVAIRALGTHDVRLHIVSTNETKSAQQIRSVNNRTGVIHDIQSSPISPKQDGCNTFNHEKMSNIQL